ncbi:SDR family NAD(P)-dependent oxidoreductase [Micromonospora sp. NPDC048905]|uniref:SDR family NAD(P)-dependent oxidoreductase n=1 Tax=Micromonospora sp. NPDC048905 TaxID=3155494 RepID=UPI0033F2B660
MSGLDTKLAGASGAAGLAAMLSGRVEYGTVAVRADAAGSVRALRLRRPGPAATDAPTEQLLRRHVLELAELPYRATRPVPELLPAGVLVLTNTTAAAAEFSLPADGTVLVVSDDTVEVRTSGGVRHLSPADWPEARAPREAPPRHVRVIVDTRDPELHVAGWSTRSGDLLRLHEWAFLAAQESADRLVDGGSYLVTVLDGITADGTPRPFTGLFTGLTKSLALDCPGALVVATVHAAGPVPATLATSVAELGAEQLLPCVYHVDGRRTTPRARPEQVDEPDAAPPPLDGSSLVVAAGGARGIGAPILLALARRYAPRIVLLGSSAPPADDDPVLDFDDPQQRSRYIREQVTGPDRVSVAAANARFDRLRDAAHMRRTLTELALHCGPGRVQYLRCDLRDTAAVRETVGAVLAEQGDIDLLINIAGINRASDLRSKSLADFRTVRDLKVRTYLNLADALRERPPARWCNFGSFVGFSGTRGETDYASANDFLNTAAAARDDGSTEHTIGWTLWRDTGLGASTVMQEFLSRTGWFTATPTEEGVAHFLAELACPRPPAATVLFGDREAGALSTVLPGLLDFCAAAPPEPTTRQVPAAAPRSAIPPQPAVPLAGPAPRAERRLPFIDDVVHRDATSLTAVRTFDLDRDGYLEHHQVFEFPTLPGTFVPELAAEVAVMLVPDRVPVVFEDLRLESFLRVYRDGRSRTKRLTARLLSSDDTESVVQVRISGDVLGPGGRVLVRDRLHFSVVVRLRDRPTPGPRWTHWDEHGSEALIDPYHASGSPVLLREVFRSTTDTRVHPLGRRGRLALDTAGIHRWFPDLLVPSVLLDGLVRVAVLERAHGRWTPVAIPRYVRRIDLYGGHTDASLATRGEDVELYVTPVDLDLEDPNPDNRAIAVSRDGEVLLQVKDIIGAIVGYLDQSTGEIVDRKTFDEMFPAPATRP